ncbi:hypothetical protein AJ79_10291 [Helicocarpus griseus UAMH5409]|uniref:Uncharacterized protein n=1 Tax=Helicocarpus griseus UAMH5409 TaxID=1447875 RepID=A0A2B7WEW7_9EURO|nr:hypothetical protein AJ79_10291 [Helicocarpus griseus UAMH5409]
MPTCLPANPPFLPTVRPSATEETSTASMLDGSPGEYYLHFCIFSVVLLRSTEGKAELHPIVVFYARHDVLERKAPEIHQLIPHRISPQQLWALDVRVTAIWTVAERRWTNSRTVAIVGGEAASIKYGRLVIGRGNKGDSDRGC